MFLEERQKEIIDKLNNTGKITVAQIAEDYNISEESARRDLRLLEQKGFCKRTYGGAVLLNRIMVAPPDDRDFRAMPIKENYKNIAVCAAGKIEKDDVIYLTSGSFGYIITQYLPKDIPFTLIVNSVDIAVNLREFDNIDVFVTCGRMKKNGVSVDSLACDFIKNFCFDKCFMTGSGLTADFGLSNGTAETAQFQRTVLQQSRKKYLLLPSVKIGTNSFIKVCDTQQFNELITDCDVSEAHIEELEKTGLKITVVGEEK